MESVFLRPDINDQPWVTRQLVDIIPNLIAYNITAYNDRSPHSTGPEVEQTLTLGATSSVVVEARSNVEFHISPNHALRLFETSVYPNTSIRTDREIFSVRYDSGSNATLLTTAGTMTLPETTTISKTTFSIASNQQCLSTTTPFGFLLDNSLQVNGNAFVNDHLVAVGNIYGNNLNMFRTYEDPSHDRVGYAFTINDDEQLELIKYSRYFDEDVRTHRIITRKIVTFGGRPFLSTDPSDVTYSAFDLLDGANVATGNIHPNNVTFSGVGTGSIRPVVDTATRGFNMTLDGNTKFSGDLVPTITSVYDMGTSNFRLRNIYATSFNVTNDAYYKGHPLVSSQWTLADSNLYFGMETPDGKGNVGIGTENPLYRLTVMGEIASSGDHIAYSDQRLKTNVHRIPDALEKVRKLSGYTFDKTDDPCHRRHAGVIAQEVRAVLPEVVHEDEQGYLSVAYGNMVGLLIEAIKEMGTRLDALETKQQVA